MAASFKHLVVLMMENRSFDHILGFLPGVNGLTGNETNPLTPEGPLVQVSQDARTVHDLIPDPGHEFINVNMQIFGNQTGTDDGQPKMQGFVRDYALVSNDSAQGANIMKCFTPTTVPVLSALAQAYAVSDSWYSSIPGSTIPNRLFAHGATSNGSLTQDVIEAPATLQTIFEAMDEPGNPYTYRIYTNGSTVLMANLYLMQRQSSFRSYSDFVNDCSNGDLPAYTFIEPSYDDNLAAGTYATSQHPDFPVDEGEGFIADVYNALTGSPGWKDTLLIVVYDEHGGIFDHVMPPNVAPSAANAALPDVQHSVNPSFDFRRLGVRVPLSLSRHASLRTGSLTAKTSNIHPLWRPCVSSSAPLKPPSIGAKRRHPPSRCAGSRCRACRCHVAYTVRLSGSVCVGDSGSPCQPHNG
jgi:phospholipase C